MKQSSCFNDCKGREGKEGGGVGRAACRQQCSKQDNCPVLSSGSSSSTVQAAPTVGSSSAALALSPQTAMQGAAAAMHAPGSPQIGTAEPLRMQDQQHAHTPSPALGRRSAAAGRHAIPPAACLPAALPANSQRLPSRADSTLPGQTLQSDCRLVQIQPQQLTNSKPSTVHSLCTTTGTAASAKFTLTQFSDHLSQTRGTDQWDPMHVNSLEPQALHPQLFCCSSSSPQQQGL